MATNNSFDKASPRLHTSRDSKFPLEMTMNRLRKAIPLLAAIISFVLIAATGLWAQKTIHVPSDVTTIQAAIEASQDGDTVLVSAGTYFENINFQGKAITLTSVSGPASTVIDGGAKNAVVTINTGEGPKSVLSGFTIRNGNSFFYGGGIEIVGSSPTITGNTITGNHAVGGVGIDISRGSPLIENNVISDNTQANGSGGGGGGIQTSGSELEPASPTIIGNLIVNNNVNAGGDGGGIFASYYGRPTVTNNFVQGNSAYNYGGGISIWSYDGAAVTQNVVVGNKSWGGGSGAGVAIFTFRTYLVNNTIFSNIAYDNSSGLYVSSGEMAITNTIANNIIIAAPGQNAVLCAPATNPTSPIFSHNDFFSPSGATYSGICDLAAGGNISVDPLLVSPGANDFHLQAVSPAIDAGDNSIPNLPQQDRDANARTIDGNNDCISVIDLGAYEFQATARGSISPSSLSFPDQLVGTAGSPIPLTLTSTGSTCLQTSTFNIVPDFTQTNTCGIGVPAGSNCTIAVRFQPTAVGTRTGTLTVLTNSSTAIPSVTLSGNGLSGAPSLIPSSISFGNVAIGGKASQTVTLKANGPGPLTVSSILATQPFSQTNKCPSTLNAGSSCKITISFKPSVVGVVNGFLTVSDNGFGSPQSVSLSGTGVKKR